MRARLAERLDPRVLLPGAKSVIAVAASYGPERVPTAPGAAARDSQAAQELLPVARYAQGRDYHNVLLKRTRKLAAWLRAAGAQVYAEVDAGAVAEKFWAMEAGLGWIGKNGLLINEKEKFGSWLLLGALVTDLALAPDAAHPDRCGDCSACIPACPTGAIQDGRLVDANRCLAYHSIESKAPIPPEFASRAGGRVFGCDACQDACPWNRRAREGTLVELRPRPAQRALPLEMLLALTEAEARERFVGTPLMRAGREGLVRSALAVCKKPLAGRSRELATSLLTDASESIRVEAARALEK
jgi:epoxyqueuosine reductase